jgi:hypothetical protein
MLALSRSGLEQRYASVVKGLLLTQTPGEFRSEEAVRVTLQDLRDSANVDLTDVASMFLERGAFLVPALSYMAARGYTQSHYDVVLRAKMSEQTEHQRALALRNIKDRMRREP